MGWATNPGKSGATVLHVYVTHRSVCHRVCGCVDDYFSPLVAYRITSNTMNYANSCETSA